MTWRTAGSDADELIDVCSMSHTASGCILTRPLSLPIWDGGCLSTLWCLVYSFSVKYSRQPASHVRMLLLKLSSHTLAALPNGFCPRPARNLTIFTQKLITSRMVCDAARNSHWISSPWRMQSQVALKELMTFSWICDNMPAKPKTCPRWLTLKEVPDTLMLDSAAGKCGATRSAAGVNERKQAPQCIYIYMYIHNPLKLVMAYSRHQRHAYICI